MMSATVWILIAIVGVGLLAFFALPRRHTESGPDHEVALGEPAPADPPARVDTTLPPEGRPRGSIPDVGVFSTAAPAPTSEHDKRGPTTTRADDIIEEPLVSHPESDQTEPISERDRAGHPQAGPGPVEPTPPDAPSDSPTPDDSGPGSSGPGSSAPSADRDAPVEHIIGSEDTGALDSGAGFDELPSIDSFDPHATRDDGDPSPSPA